MVQYFESFLPFSRSQSVQMSWLEDTMISCSTSGHQMPSQDPFPAFRGLSAAPATPTSPQVFTLDSRRNKILGLALAHDKKMVFWLTVEVSALLERGTTD